MVSYQKWTSIGYDVARQKGADIDGEGTASNNRDLVSVLAEVWNERKDELSTATVAEARDLAHREIQVS